MIGEYTCQYIHNSGKICNTLCTRPEGCRLHYKAKKNVYFVLIVENQLLLLVDDAKFIKEDIMLHPIIKGFVKKL